MVPHTPPTQTHDAAAVRPQGGKAALPVRPSRPAALPAAAPASSVLRRAHTPQQLELDLRRPV
jgi:hypothetical protein